MLRLFMGGGEINAFGELLESMGVDTITVSYMGLRRRIKNLDKVNLADRFSVNTQILLDSGCHTINSAPDSQYSDDELKQIATEYDAFVDRHRDRLYGWTEFDAVQLGKEWIASRRPGVMAEIAVWHEEDGLNALEELCQTTDRVGVTGTSLGDRDLTPLLQRAAREGTELYGLGMTKPEQMAAIEWTGVTSTSWLSPVKFRDLIVWSGTELKRYPRKNREQGKKRHRILFRDIGIDPDLIDEDNNSELLKLSVWSWLQQVAHINGTTAPEQIATSLRKTPVSGNAETDENKLAHRPTEPQSSELVDNAPRQRPTRLLPGLTVETTEESYVNDEGTRLKRNLKLVRTNSESVLQCSGCYLAGKCPAFEPGAACVYEIPVEIRTKDQLASVQAALMEMQVKRVLRGGFTEEVEGGYLDPNLSQEIDRLNRMIKTKHEMDSEGFSLTIKANQTAARTTAHAGVLSRLFGEDAARPVQELPAPVPIKSAAEQLGILDAEVVEEDAA